MKLTTELSIESLQGKSGQEADHSPLSSAIVKNFQSCIFTSTMGLDLKVQCGRLFWTCVDVVLHVLSQQDLTAGIQSDTDITGKQQHLCLCHISDIQEHGRMHVLNVVCQENWNQTCDKTTFQDKAMNYTLVFEWFHHIIDEHRFVESEECFGHPQLSSNDG